MTQSLVDQIERGDPTRFAALLAAPVAARTPLATLYAFNLEIARAPWVTKEPMIAEMRLQWWRDALEDATNGTIRAHEVMQPLADLMRHHALPLETLDQMVEARRWDIYSDPFADETALDDYLMDTAGGLMWLAAKALGAGAASEPALRAFGWATGLASYLQAVPDLVDRGRIPLLDGRDEGITNLANQGLARLATARTSPMDAAARPAMLAGWQAHALLTLAANEPARVGDGTLQLSEFSRRGRLLWQTFTHRF